MTNRTIPRTISGILEKMDSNDIDFRFMALSDLINELQKSSLKADSNSELMLARKIVSLLFDNNGEVQGLAIKALGPLVKNVSTQVVAEMIDTLIKQLSTVGDSQKESVCGLGLRSIIVAIEEKGSVSINELGIDKAIPVLLNFVNEHKIENVRLEACEALSEMINIFGNILISYHPQLLRTVLMCLYYPRPALRKRAIQACCGLSWSVEDTLFSCLCEFLLIKTEICCEIENLVSSNLSSFLANFSSILQSSMNLADLKTSLQCFCAIARNSPRLASFVDRVIIMCSKLLLEPSTLSCFTEGEFEDSDIDDVRELAFQILEVIIRGPSRPSSTKLVQQIVPVLLKNYNQNSEEMDQDDEEVDSESHVSDESEEEDDDEYGEDDEDTNWKVRRAAIRCIDACITSYPQETVVFYKMFSTKLLKIFEVEREESVRLELCICLSGILRQTRLASTTTTVTVSSHSSSSKSESSNLVLQNAPNPSSLLGQQIQNELEGLLKDPNSAHYQLNLIMPQLCKFVFLQCATPGTVLSDGFKRTKSLPKMSPNVRHAGIMLVKDLAFSMPSHMSSFFEPVIAIVHSVLGDSSFSNTSKIDFVNVLVLLLVTHPNAVLKPHLSKLIDVTALGLKDGFYRVVLEALDLCQLLVRSLKSLGGTQFVNSLVKPLLIQVEAQDRDLELKEKSLSTAAIVVGQVGDLMDTDDVTKCLEVIKTRLSNETMRLTAVKSIQMLVSMAVSELSNNLFSSFLPNALRSVSEFLSKNSRNPRLASILCLQTAWSSKTHYLLGTSGDAQIAVQTCISNILKEIPKLIQDEELLAAHLSVKLLITLLRLVNEPQTFVTQSNMESLRVQMVSLISSENFLDSILALSQAPLLQGSVQQQSVLSLMLEIGRFSLEAKKPDIHAVISKLLRSTHGPAGLLAQEAPQLNAIQPVHRDALPNVAACVVQVLSCLPQQDILSAIESLVLSINNGKLNCAQLYINLSILGGLSSKIDLSDKSELFDLLVKFCVSSNTPASAQSRGPRDSFGDASHSTTGGTVSPSVGSSIALGKFVLGNPRVLMPKLLHSIAKAAEEANTTGNSNQFYHLLQALRECIITSLFTQQAYNEYQPHVNHTMSLLASYAYRPEEGIRALVSECVGRLILMNVHELLEQVTTTIDNSGSAENANVRSTMVSAIKYLLISPENTGISHTDLNRQEIISNRLQRQESVYNPDEMVANVNSPLISALAEVETVLREKPVLLKTLSFLNDPQIVVRRAALILFNTVAHQKPSLLRPLLVQKASKTDLTIAQLLFQETNVRQELIREVEMGPFRQKEDDGLECRKYAFECLATLLDTCANRLDMQSFLLMIASGLSDQKEIKILCLQILQRLGNEYPMDVIAKLNELAIPIKNLLLIRPKEGQIPIDAVEPMKCAVRLIANFSSILEIKKHQNFVDIFRTMETQEIPKKLYQEFQLSDQRISR